MYAGDRYVVYDKLNVKLNQMKIFTLFWLTGKTELVKGNTPEEAMTLAGYGAGAIPALDFYGNGDVRYKYAWNMGARKWGKIKPY